MGGRDATAVARETFQTTTEDLDHVGPVVRLAAERQKHPDQFGERALDAGVVVEEADADVRRSGFHSVGRVPHDLARQGEVWDFTRRQRGYRRHGLLRQQAQHKAPTVLIRAQSRLTGEQPEAGAGHAQIGRAGLVESSERFDLDRYRHIHPGEQPALREHGASGLLTAAWPLAGLCRRAG